MKKKLAVAAALSLPCLAFTAVSADAAAVPAKWANCTTVNKRLPHGVGLAKARDKTSGTPVTTFRRDTAMYRAADAANGRLDGDNDGIACEKA
jgi:hypothetical protein